MSLLSPERPLLRKYRLPLLLPLQFPDVAQFPPELPVQTCAAWMVVAAPNTKTAARKASKLRPQIFLVFSSFIAFLLVCFVVSVLAKIHLMPLRVRYALSGGGRILCLLLPLAVATLVPPFHLPRRTASARR